MQYSELHFVKDLELTSDSLIVNLTRSMDASLLCFLTNSWCFSMELSMGHYNNIAYIQTCNGLFLSS